MAPVPNFHFLHSLISLLSVPWKKQIICFYIYYFICWKFTAFSKRQENASEQTEQHFTNSELIEMASTHENITTVHILALTTSEDIKQWYLHYFLNKFFLILRNCYRALCGIRRNV